MTTKIHATCDALGNPTDFHLTPIQSHDLEGSDALLPKILNKIGALLADKAYDAEERVLRLLPEAGGGIVIRQSLTGLKNVYTIKTSICGDTL